MSLNIPQPAPAGVILDTHFPHTLYHSWYIGHRGILTIIPDPQYLASATSAKDMALRMEDLSKRVFKSIEVHFQSIKYQANWFSLLTGVFVMHRLGKNQDLPIFSGFLIYLKQSPYYQRDATWSWREPYDNNQGVTGWFQTQVPAYEASSFKAQISHTPDKPAFYEIIAQLPEQEGLQDLGMQSQVHVKFIYQPLQAPPPRQSGELPQPAGPFQLLAYADLIHYPAYQHVWQTPHTHVEVLTAHLHQAFIALANRTLPTFDKKHYFPPQNFQGVKLYFSLELNHIQKRYEESEAFKELNALLKTKAIA